MSDKNLRVFISSTFEDLAEHRHAARDAVLRMGAMPVVIEDQPASGRAVEEKVREWIGRSDAVVLLVGHRYGAIKPDTDKSWVEAEYDAIQQQGKPLLVFLADENAPWPVRFVDRDQSKIEKFRHRLAADRVVRFFSGPDDLRTSVMESLSGFLQALKEEPRPTSGKESNVKEVRLIRMLLSSPGDVAEERNRVANAVFRFNQWAVEEKGLFVKLVRWEDMAPQIGPVTQEVINKQIGTYHLFVGVMWNRFGTPTEIASSGTKEEFDAAVHAWENERRPWITFYFCDRPANFTTPEQLEQKSKVLEFRSELNGKGVVRSFLESKEFEDLVYEDLKRIVDMPDFQRILGAG